jgi:hypothetical protein
MLLTASIAAERVLEVRIIFIIFGHVTPIIQVYDTAYIKVGPFVQTKVNPSLSRSEPKTGKNWLNETISS